MKFTKKEIEERKKSYGKPSKARSEVFFGYMTRWDKIQLWGALAVFFVGALLIAGGMLVVPTDAYTGLNLSFSGVILAMGGLFVNVLTFAKNNERIMAHQLELW